MAEEDHDADESQSRPSRRRGGEDDFLNIKRADWGIILGAFATILAGGLWLGAQNFLKPPNLQQLQQAQQQQQQQQQQWRQQQQQQFPNGQPQQQELVLNEQQGGGGGGGQPQQQPQQQSSGYAVERDPYERTERRVRVKEIEEPGRRTQSDYPIPSV